MTSKNKVASISWGVLTRAWWKVFHSGQFPALSPERPLMPPHDLAICLAPTTRWQRLSGLLLCDINSFLLKRSEPFLAPKKIMVVFMGA